ncbi:MAG TPA: metallophosphoesterase [Chromatiaceae bacterium]|jgi:putative phosphoesterase|nr:metallophosphoesterase [Chromatiaceae bacterium]HIB83181.1 metallophosphoesterase [Chromatiaceae bacterium]HIN82230.1 metallophosphoesterase [Chromatiales bacterium]HIO14548.1 metallophosphoesterase [Chromatiales bacterium]HIO54069.1 metallophosphoesterase [Chromatiales bacterium]
MKICVLSDSHDNLPLLEAAARDAKAAGAEAILHCGDVVAPSTLKVLFPLKLPVHVIHGNNSGDPWAMGRIVKRSEGMIQYHGQDAELELAGHKIFVVHYPHYARALATTGDYKIICCGHSHKPAIQQVANMKGGMSWVVNPGTVGGVGNEPATYIFADLKTMEFEVKTLDKNSHTVVSKVADDLYV